MRKLMFAAIGYTAALIAAHYIISDFLQLYFALGCFIISFCGFLFRKNLRKAILILLISASIGLLWNSLHGKLYIKPAEELIETSQRVEARVLDAPNIIDDYATVTLRLTGKGLPSTKVLVTDYNGSLSELNIGDIINIDLKFRSARIRYNTEDDYYLSSGIFLRAYTDGECEIIGHRRAGIFDWPKILAESLKNHILRMFPDDIAPLMKALLTGDKKELYEDDELYVSLKMAGLSHIIAVSGMHVSFIISLIALATGRRRITAFLGIPLVWFFAAMTGFGPSVVRASLMISLMLLAPILRRENDPPTTLSAALLILLLINPQSIGSISLQFSFSAMAGILMITPRIYRSILNLFSETKGIFARVLRGLTGVFSSSVGALIFTTPLAAIHFGYVPLYSVFTNMLCLWAMSTAFMLAYPVCIIGAVYMPAGKILAWLISWLARYAVIIVKFIAGLPYSALFTRNNLLGWWLVFVYAVLFIPWFFRGRKAYRPVIPICCCIISFIAVTFISNHLSTSGPAVAAVDVGQGQCIVASTMKATVVIDCGGRGSTENAGDSAAEFLLSSSRRNIELLVLTHLHDDHANGVVRLMNYVDVERVAIPEDCEETEIGDIILQTCYDKNIEIIYINKNTNILVDDLSLELFAPIGSEDPNEKGLIVLGDYGEFEFLVTGDAGIGTEDQLVNFYPIGDIELLVVGHHGSKYSTGEALLEGVSPDSAFISVGTNSYGHPTDEVLTRLLNHSIEVYRTDINGNIIMLVGKTNG